MEAIGFLIAAFITVLWFSFHENYKITRLSWVILLTPWILWLVSITLNNTMTSTSTYTKHDVLVLDNVTYSTPKDVNVTVTIYPWWSTHGNTEDFAVVGER
jgi:hypothetical protein